MMKYMKLQKILPLLFIPDTVLASNEYLIIYATPLVIVIASLLFIVPVFLIILCKYKSEYFLQKIHRKLFFSILKIPLVFLALGILLNIMLLSYTGYFSHTVTHYSIILSFIAMVLMYMNYKMIKYQYIHHLRQLIKNHDFNKEDICAKENKNSCGKDIETDVCISNTRGIFKITIVEKKGGNIKNYSNEFNNLNQVIEFILVNTSIGADEFLPDAAKAQ